MPRRASSFVMPDSATTRSGSPDAKAPKAAHNAPVNAYLANKSVLDAVSDAAANLACSKGRKTLTSPELGLSVPTNATIRSGQNDDKTEKPSPVTTISAAAPSINPLPVQRWPHAPTAKVAKAEPNRVAVAMAPTSTPPSPISSK